MSERKIKKNDLILYVIIALCLFICVSMKISEYKDGVSSVFGYRPFFIVSESMEPTIEKNSIVLSKTVKAKDVKVGDVIGYESCKKIIIHRVIGINSDGTFEFLGDNNSEQLDSDRRVTAEQIRYRIIM